MLRAVAEHFQPVVSPVADTCVILADEHVNQVVHAETLAGSGDAGHGLLRGLGAVPGLRRVHTVVAIPAGFPRLFPEVSANGATAAGGEFAQTDHRFQFPVLHPLVRLVGFGPGQPLAEDDDFLQAVIHPRAGRQAVTARTPRFLVIGLNALRQAEMGDKAHVGFIDAHAESHCGDNHHALLAQEPFLVTAARVIRKPRVIGQRVAPAGAQPFGDLLHLFSRQAIDDTGVVGMLALQKTPQALAPVIVVGNGVVDVGTITTVDIDVGLFQLQLGNDFPAGRVVRGGRQSNARDRGITLVQHRQLQILLTEVVSPARHAMSLVNGEQGDGLPQLIAQESDFLHTLMDNAPDHIYFKDIESKFIRINRSLANRFGLKNPAEAIGKSDFDFFTREHAQQAYQDERTVIDTGKPIEGKREKETWPGGQDTWVSTTKVPIRDRSGRIKGTCGISRDITEYHRADQALRDSEAKWRSLVESAPDIITTLDLDYRLQFINRIPAGVDLTVEDVIGKSVFDFLTDEHHD